MIKTQTHATPAQGATPMVVTMPLAATSIARRLIPRHHDQRMRMLDQKVGLSTQHTKTDSGKWSGRGTESGTEKSVTAY